MPITHETKNKEWLNLRTHVIRMMPIYLMLEDKMKECLKPALFHDKDNTMRPLPNAP